MHAEFAVDVNQLVGTCSRVVHIAFLLWSITWSLSVLTQCKEVIAQRLCCL
jgi:hypothetical protein